MRTIPEIVSFLLFFFFSRKTVFFSILFFLCVIRCRRFWCVFYLSNRKGRSFAVTRFMVGETRSAHRLEGSALETPWTRTGAKVKKRKETQNSKRDTRTLARRPFFFLRVFRPTQSQGLACPQSKTKLGTGNGKVPEFRRFPAGFFFVRIDYPVMIGGKNRKEWDSHTGTN